MNQIDLIRKIEYYQTFSTRYVVSVHENKSVHPFLFNSTACVKKSSFNEVDLDKSEK